MLSAEEQRILREIEHGLHDDDPWFPLHMTMVRLRCFRHCRAARGCLVSELVSVALAVIGLVSRVAELVIVGAGLAILVVLVVLVCWLELPVPPDPPPDPW